MELTEIKIPGKNRRNPRQGKPAASKIRGRPLRSAKSLSTAPNLPKKPRILRNIKSPHKLRSVEKLPTEIITCIFLHNPSPALALASPILAARLSHESVYTETLLSTFAPYWELQFRGWADAGSRASGSEDDDFRHEDLPPEASSLVQSSILRCRWATLARLRHAESTFLRRKLKDLPRSLALPERYKSLSDDFFVSDWEEFVDMVPRPGHEVLELETRLKPLLQFRDGVVEIPISVLRAPWTEEKVQYLWYLRRAGARIEKWSSTAGEVAATGLESAILSCNIHATHLLARFRIFTPLTTPLILQSLGNLLTLSRSHGAEKDLLSSARRPVSYPNLSLNPSTSLWLEEQIRIKDFSRVLAAFVSYFAACEETRQGRERRRAEVEREILQLRRGWRSGLSQGVEEKEMKRTKAEGEWMVRALGDIYGLDVSC